MVGWGASTCNDVRRSNRGKSGLEGPRRGGANLRLGGLFLFDHQHCVSTSCGKDSFLSGRIPLPCAPSGLRAAFGHERRISLHQHVAPRFAGGGLAAGRDYQYLRAAEFPVIWRGFKDIRAKLYPSLPDLDPEP